jgi:hypothetical protein
MLDSKENPKDDPEIKTWGPFGPSCHPSYRKEEMERSLRSRQIFYFPFVVKSNSSKGDVMVGINRIIYNMVIYI